jgi:micrococcal nuclease
MTRWYAGALGVALVSLISACGGLGQTGLNSLCGSEEAVVARVLDGDTVELEDGKKIRYLHVDTPEIAHNGVEQDQCFAQEARQLNQELVEGKTVQLEYDLNCADRFGRTLAFVSVEGRMVNQILIERGYAELAIFEPNVALEDEFKALEEQARETQAGLWGACQ